MPLVHRTLLKHAPSPRRVRSFRGRPGCLEDPKTTPRSGAFRGCPPNRPFAPMRPMALDAMIFDIDGTLVDSNPAHVEAWRRALESHGYQIAADRIQVEIGKGGDKVVP